MINNDVLRQLRYALNINDSTMIKIFKLADRKIEQSHLTGLLKKEEEKKEAKKPKKEKKTKKAILIAVMLFWGIFWTG